MSKKVLTQHAFSLAVHIVMRFIQRLPGEQVVGSRRFFASRPDHRPTDVDVDVDVLVLSIGGSRRNAPGIAHRNRICSIAVSVLTAL